MTEKEYRQSEGISRSELWRMKDSPEKFKWFLEHPDDPTPALIFGAALHKLILEPDTFYDEFTVQPSVDRRTKEGKAMWETWLADNEGKTPVSVNDMAKMQAMADAVNANSYAKLLLDGKHELPVFWKDELTGELCKVRLDCLKEVNGKTLIVDYKTTGDASTEAFIRSAIKYGYHFQAAMYIEGYRQATGVDAQFVFIAQEKEPPYSINILQADDLLVNHGHNLFREYIGLYHDCKLTGNWWGYLGPYNMVNNLPLPAYLAGD